MTAILLTHASATLALCGLIWFVQVVHYPLFARADRDTFASFCASHQRRTSLIVVPLMLTEAATATILAARPPDGASVLARAGLALLAIVWLSTFFLQVPRHRELLRGFRSDALQSLVRTNWIRTASWTGRAALALALIARGMAA